MLVGWVNPNGSSYAEPLVQNGPDHMSELIMWTYDWVPKGPRGFVRDLRLRWACEEAGLAYSVRTVPFDGRETNHLARQPFGQVPFLSDGEVEIFESGAGLLHLARKSERLMPRDPAGEAETVQWVIAALNSIEMVTVPWWFLRISGEKDNGLAGWMASRLDQLEKVLAERDWLAAGRFTAADLLMADALRVRDVRAFGHRPATDAYVARVTDRPAFRKARADQLAHFAAADEKRPAAG
jgi:glutathione S-transferase